MRAKRDRTISDALPIRSPVVRRVSLLPVARRLSISKILLDYGTRAF